MSLKLQLSGKILGFLEILKNSFYSTMCGVYFLTLMLYTIVNYKVFSILLQGAHFKINEGSLTIVQTEDVIDGYKEFLCLAENKYGTVRSETASVILACKYSTHDKSD